MFIIFYDQPHQVTIKYLYFRFTKMEIYVLHVHVRNI
jgi:hypothetical protein